MKKVSKILCMALCSLMFVGCGNKESENRMMEEAKIAFASKEYEKAESIFKLAMDETDNKEAGKLYIQVQAFRNIKSLIDDMKMEEKRGFINTTEEESINNMQRLFNYFSVFDTNKSDSNLVINELEYYTSEFKIGVIQFINQYRQYLSDYNIDKASLYLYYLKEFDKYNLSVLEDYKLDINSLEKELKEHEK